MCENTHVFEVQKAQLFLQEKYVLLVEEIMLTVTPIGACSFVSPNVENAILKFFVVF